MHDIKQIRENPMRFDMGLAKRGLPLLSAQLIAMDAELRACETELQQCQFQRNELAKEIGSRKTAGTATTELIKAAENSKAMLAELEAKLNSKRHSFETLMSTIPNTPSDDVPEGGDEKSNIEIKVGGSIRDFDFPPLHHYELGEHLGQMDFGVAAKISGSRFVMLFHELAAMERALANFMLDIHTKEFGYIEVMPPTLVKDEAMFGVGQLPKFDIDSFLTRERLRLIPTSEVSLTNIVKDSILEEHQLPLRYTAYSQCFRSEAGSAGKDTKGMIRNHQFSKVELVSITSPQDSDKEHERMLNCAEEILRRLELPYRISLLCGGDLGFASSKTYDLEVWLPAQKQYREISSCSNCLSFQARRMKARYKELSSGKNIIVHTLNGSGLAIGRTIVAILENYQNADRTINIPAQLQKYMNGLTTIRGGNVRYTGN